MKGYAAQESSVLIGVSEARAGAMPVKSDASITTDPAAFQRYAAAQNSLSVALAPMRVLQENYPDLKANQNFLALQSQLEGTENRIAVERGRYNDTVKDYNVAVRSFPMNLFAAMFNFKEALMYPVPDASKAVPKVAAPATLALSFCPRRSLEVVERETRVTPLSSSIACA